MKLDEHQTQALQGLCSDERTELLDAIDSLRSQGINHYVSLPEIIVCGDQSSGKSSVLEAISGVSFPIKSSLCTRFPTELVLRRSADTGVRVAIVPHHTRTAAEKESLAAFDVALDNLDGFAGLVEEAKTAMGITTHGKTFSKDLLHIEISGPDRPHLTIVDLPGLIHSETRHQTSEDVQLIQDVVMSYMQKPRSIILAVVSAKNDLANQVVIKLTRTADPDGLRTLGVITKPDTLYAGSHHEADYVALARNENVNFRLGWHVLRNMDSDVGKGSLAQRDALEAAFFRAGVWTALPPSTLGILQLRRRLSGVLLTHIVAELPSLTREIEQKRSACAEGLQKLGKPRLELDAQREYLFEVSQHFQHLVKSAVHADWADRFFQDVQTTEGYEQRIRSVVKSLNRQFAQDLADHGHRYSILAPKANKPFRSTTSGTVYLTRKKFVRQTMQRMSRSAGRELPGLFDPMIIGDLFRDQASPWEGIARAHVHRAWKACKVFLRHVAVHIADTGTSSALLLKVLDPAMEEIRATLEAKVTAILQPLQALHPITNNALYKRDADRLRDERRRRDLAQTIKTFFGISSLENVYVSQQVDFSALVDELELDEYESGTDEDAASKALDYTEAYYKVCMRRFIDNVAVDAVEVCLLSALVDVLSPLKVFKMTPDFVTSVAGESEESRSQREQLQRQLDVLGSGADICKRYAGVDFDEVVSTADDAASDDGTTPPSVSADVPQLEEVEEKEAEPVEMVPEPTQWTFK